MTVERGSSPPAVASPRAVDLPTGQLHLADNLETLPEIASGSIDLVYLDPPFHSRTQHRGTGDGRGRSAAFDDTWPWSAAAEDAFDRAVAGSPSTLAHSLRGLELLVGRTSRLAYLTMMAPRLEQLRRVLSGTGSIYLHCDGSASHYLKVLMDAVFGKDCFLNNVVWLYGLGGSSGRYWPRKHDDILWYARRPDGHYFEPAMVPARSARMRGQSKKAPDWWDIPSLNNMAAERVGYPTQKPLALLERIVVSSCPPGGVVLDPFCGSGTTLVAAHRNGRRWRGIDREPVAIEIARTRLAAGEGLLTPKSLGP